MSLFENVDILVSYGISPSIYEKAHPWLKKNPKRRLLFVEENREIEFLPQDRQVQLFFLDSPLQIEPLAKKLAWQAVFLKVAFLDEAGSKKFSAFQKHFEECHLAAHLLLSDGADWGVAAARNAKKNLARPFRSVFAMEGKFLQVPAIIVGAGPSLKKNKHLLKELSDRALIFAGGTALRYVEPHFGASIDQQAPPLQSKSVPFCFQARVHPPNLTSMRGELLLAPDSHFSFLNWIAGIDPVFEGGWTVGNFLTRLALLWGCNPIVFVGMDSCYREGEKYPGQNGSKEGLIEVLDREGNRVFTQRDWIQAARWTQELAKGHPERQWINATEGGMGFGEPIEEKKLEEISFSKQGDLREKIQRTLQEIPPSQQRVRWKEWEESLRRCQSSCEGEIAYETLLLPMWQLWKPVFEREFPEGEMDLHRTLFFQSVIEEHLHA